MYPYATANRRNTLACIPSSLALHLVSYCMWCVQELSAHTALAAAQEHMQATTLQPANLPALTTSQMSSCICQAKQQAWVWAWVGAPFRGSSTPADTNTVSTFMKGSHYGCKMHSATFLCKHIDYAQLLHITITRSPFL